MRLTDQQTEAVVDMVRDEIVHKGKVYLDVATDSMYPMIKSGDKVMVKDWPVEELRRGDILLYHNHHSIYTHRLLYKNSTATGIMLITKGDALKTFDSPFSPACFLGRVVAIQKRHRSINLQAPWWRMVNWVLAAFSLMEAPFRTMRDNLRRILSGGLNR